VSYFKQLDVQSQNDESNDESSRIPPGSGFQDGTFLRIGAKVTAPSSPSRNAHDESNEEDYKENEKQKFCDSRGCRRDARKSEDGSQNRDDQEC
jgi:hypothetical protein